MNLKEDKVEQMLVTWAEQQPMVRAVVLTSSRAIAHAPSDVFSDYDVILVLRDVVPFHTDRAWLSAFGPLLVLYRDPLEEHAGYHEAGYVTQYADGLKLDFSLWSIESMQQIAAGAHLPAEFDAGYRVLLDKDHLTDSLQPPTFQAYIPTPPSLTQYEETIESFFLTATYVAKLLWRDDFMAAKFLLDGELKHETIRPMLEWHFEIQHGWTVKPGPYGRRMKRWLRPDLWAALEGTYAGVGLEQNWESLFKTMALMRQAALEVGEALGFAYPEEMEQRVRAYMLKVKNLEPGAEKFMG